MPPASVASNVSQSLDVQSIEPPQISFHSVLVYLLTQICELLFTEFPGSLVLYALHNSCVELAVTLPSTYAQNGTFQTLCAAARKH